MARARLPKALRGWREFAGEIVIIVIGVLLALGAQQAVETTQHRAQVRQATEKLRIESLDNRRVADYDLGVLQRLVAVVDRDIARLGGCRNPGVGGTLEPIPQDQIFLPGTVTWQSIRDGALLPLMPERAVDNYSKIDSMLGAYAERMLDLRRLLDRTTGAVEAMRGGGNSEAVCDETLLALNQLKQTALSVTQHTRIFRGSNERALRGDRIDVDIRLLGP